MTKTVQEERQRKAWEEYIVEGMEARERKDNSQWILGDLAQAISTDYGEDTIGKYGYAIGVEKKTLMNYRTVAGKFDKELRNKYRKLSFGHFASLVAVGRPAAWLNKADSEEWSVENLRKEVRKAYPSDKGPKLDDNPPEVYRCPECGGWRLKGMSADEICRGHYKLDKKGNWKYY